MWFEQMHPQWQRMLANQRMNLNALEIKTSGLPNLLPPKQLVMSAFEADPQNLNVVILGQDPYPTPGAAIGQAFAIHPGSKLPASLKNIESELLTDVGTTLSDPSLSSWRAQGVWLLNTCLTTLENQPNAHSKIGWQDFTETALATLASRCPIVILAWGKPAQKLANQVATEQTRIIESAHPSPLSAHRGFLGSHPFSRANQALNELGLRAIDW